MDARPRAALELERAICCFVCPHPALPQNPLSGTRPPRPSCPLPACPRAICRVPVQDKDKQARPLPTAPSKALQHEEGGGAIVLALAWPCAHLPLPTLTHPQGPQRGTYLATAKLGRRKLEDWKPCTLPAKTQRVRMILDMVEGGFWRLASRAAVGRRPVGRDRVKKDVKNQGMYVLRGRGTYGGSGVGAGHKQASFECPCMKAGCFPWSAPPLAVFKGNKAGRRRGRAWDNNA